MRGTCGVRATQAIDVVEAGYRLEGSEAAWLEALLDVAARDLDTGSGLYAFTGDSSGLDFAQRPIFAERGLPPPFRDAVARMNATAPPEVYDYLGRRLVACGGFQQVFGADSPVVTHFRKSMASTGIVDGFSVFAQDAAGGSVILASPAPTPSFAPPRVRGIWQRVGLHVVAGLRLRRRLAASASRRDALLSPSGKVEDASPAVAADGEARRALTEAVRAMDQARRAKTRASPEDALELWRGLVAGQWSLVEHWEDGGRRYVAAYLNGPGGQDPRALTASERALLPYLSLGATNKEASWALGLPEKTVSASVPQILRKLGMRSRVALTGVLHPARATRLNVQVGDEQLDVLAFDAGVDGALRGRLTKAELEIAELVARGWSNARIARERAVAASTVAKQLQGIFDKLGLASRSRLAGVIARGQFDG